MPERVTSVKTTAFRGVRDSFTVNLANGCSLVVFGDNGTGKSTIADALEWYFTGHIDFLRHEGRRQALRHLAAPSTVTTSVEIQTTGSLSGAITFPDGAVPTRVAAIGGQETFLLRGRTLVQFVEKSKAEKWKAVTEILGLDAVDQVRLSLQRAKNDLQREHDAAVAELRTRIASLSSRVGVVTDEGVLNAIRGKCAEAGVAGPATLDVALDVAWWKSVTALDDTAAHATTLTSLAAELRAVAAPSVDRDAVRRWNATVAATKPRDRRRLALFRAAEGYLLETPPNDACPLCGQGIRVDALADRIKQILHSLIDAVDQLEDVERRMKRAADALNETGRRLTQVTATAAGLGVSLPPPPQNVLEVIRKSLEDRTEVDPADLEAYSNQVASWLIAAVNGVEAELPTPRSEGRAALVEVGALAADARGWRASREGCARAEQAFQICEQIFSVYQKRQRDYVEKILQRISARVAAIYEKLHPGEGLGSVQIEPWTDKGIELAVDFHGTRQKPPHGVLSESHLNSLAIALFLAMAETFNDQLRFLVLDDIVNSFDIEHRGHLAKLLADEFREWQLIVLTHDHLFYDHIRKRARGWATLEFTSWSYEEGPRTAAFATGAMLEKAEQCLPDDPTGAAQKGRRALEELLQEVSEALHAPLPFRRGAKNDQRESGELFAGIRRELKESSKALLKDMEPLLKDLEADLAAALNVESHASRGRASPEEVEAALDRIHELDRKWTCIECGTRIWHKGAHRASRCECGRAQFPPVPVDPGARDHIE